MYSKTKIKNALCGFAFNLINIDETRIFTTGTTHCLVGKYLANLLNPLTINEYSVKDSFDAANRIKGISQHLFENGYQHINEY